ncbi:MHP1 MAP-homologous protein 1 [Candida maltosa Xu316]
MRDILEEETNIYTKGVKDTDVDWFIRDSSIDPNIDISLATNTNNDPSLTASPASHLTAAISNSNDNYTNKTKPSIAPIQEENIASDTSPHHNQQHYHEPPPRRRSSVAASSSGGGLFSKLKNKFHKESPMASPSPSPLPQQQIFKSDFNMNSRKKSVDSSTSSIDSFSSSPPNPVVNTSKLQRTMSSPAYSHDTVDPRLDEYIKFYQRKDSRRASVVSNGSHKEECLTSALVNGSDASPNKAKEAAAATESTTAKLSSFLKRKNSISTKYGDSNTSLPGTPLSRQGTPQSFSKSGLESNPSFKGLKPLKRVAFHSSTFLIDPPQQIPSRTPRKGNVEVLPNGTVNVRPLTEEERLEMEKSQRGLGGGIVVGGTGALGYLKKDADLKPVNESTTTNDDDTDDIESSQSSEESQEANEPAVDAHAKSYTIDKPMVQHKPVTYSVPVQKMALDTMYSRCCHLREILPIPAILKQIPKGSLAPIPVLQLRNPTPTMIEIQSFADFLRIAPVICVCFDGVNFSVEQFKILLSAMSAKKQLEKLSLRNTPINEEGWSLLCWFLSRNTVLNKLDVTQCPSLSVNVLKKKKKKTEGKFEETLIRMTGNKDNRSDVDWELFVATLIARGGIEELILTGCCIPDIEVFEKLMSLAVSKRTSRLGLAFNQLTARHLKIIVDNWLFKDFARGIDLGYNDFSSVHMLRTFLDYTKSPDYDKVVTKSSLSFLSLNSTNTAFNDVFKETMEKVLIKLPNLKYLDLSNNQRLFGTFGKTDHINADPSETASVEYFISKLPLFPKLIRLHLENDNFSQSSIVQIAEILPLCKNLGYFSILGTKLDLTCASALVNAVKNSKSIINLDCDSEDFPEIFKERIGLYTMRNMERLLYTAKKADAKTPFISEPTNSESLTEQLHEILAMKAQKKLDLKSPEVVKFVTRAQSIRHELRQTTNELLKLQLKNTLDLDGKETLIRLIFIDSSIEKGLQLIDPKLINENDEIDKMTLKTMVGTREGNGDGPVLEQAEQKDLKPDSNLFVSQQVPMSRSSSRSSLNNLSKEEGSVLKLAKLRDFHKPNSPYPEATGEELRKKLMSVELSDLDKIIGFLSDLKKQGVSLEKVFQSGNGDQDHDFLNIEEIKSKIESLSVEQVEDKNKEPADNKVNNNNNNDDKREILRTTYDQVLNNLTK